MTMMSYEGCVCNADRQILLAHSSCPNLDEPKKQPFNSTVEVFARQSIMLVWEEQKKKKKDKYPRHADLTTPRLSRSAPSRQIAAKTVATWCCRQPR